MHGPTVEMLPTGDTRRRTGTATGTGTTARAKTLGSEHFHEYRGPPRYCFASWVGGRFVYTGYTFFSFIRSFHLRRVRDTLDNTIYLFYQ